MSYVLVQHIILLSGYFRKPFFKRVKQMMYTSVLNEYFVVHFFLFETNFTSLFFFIY